MGCFVEYSTGVNALDSGRVERFAGSTFSQRDPHDPSLGKQDVIPRVDTQRGLIRIIPVACCFAVPSCVAADSVGELRGKVPRAEHCVVGQRAAVDAAVEDDTWTTRKVTEDSQGVKCLR